MFNYYCDCEFCFPGWRARLFLIITTITSFVFSGGVRGYFLITTTIAHLFFFRVACTVIFKLLYLLRVLFLGVACTVIFTYYYYHQLFSGLRARIFLKYYYCCELCFLFSRGVHGYFLITTTTACLVLFGWCARLFYLVLLSRVFEWRARSFF